MTNESRLVWHVVKRVGEERFLMERIEDRVASGRPDVLWCVKGDGLVMGRVELKYLSLRKGRGDWYGEVVETSKQGRKILNKSATPNPPARIRGIAPGLRLDQALHLARWGAEGARCGCLLRVDDLDGCCWLWWAAPNRYPRKRLASFPVWAKEVVSTEALSLLSDSHEGPLTTEALWRFLLPDVSYGSVATAGKEAP